MNPPTQIVKVLALLGAIFLFAESGAQSSYDSLKIKLPKHYFQTVIVMDGYRKPKQNIPDTVDILSQRLKTFAVHQFVFSLSTPVFTSEHFTSDSLVKNTHVLLTANYLRLQPVFDGIYTHQLTKTGIGARIIVNSGKKGIWFFDVSPFVTKDATYPSKPYARLASTVVYSHNVSPRFNWRIGATKSFQWGNRNYLPFVGVRFGRLDKINFSLQFPRSMALNVPISQKVALSFYTKPQGGMFNFSNHDSLYYLNNDATFHFTHSEITTGARADIRVTNWFNFYVALGFSTENRITFYSETANSKRSKLPYSKYFYNEVLPSTGFFNCGLSFRFGKTRSYYNNTNIYDAIDLNNTAGGDDNLNNGNSQIPLNTRRKKAEADLKSVQDLIDYNDF